MEWQHPQALYLILPLSVAWLVLTIYSERRRQRAREAFMAQAMWQRLLPEPSGIRYWIKQVFRIVAIVAGLVALAGPRFGTEVEQIVPKGSDLYVLIDVSRSMLAEDVAPSRLGRAKADVSALVNRLQGERVGLIAFAGQAVVKCPLTVDYDSFRRALQELDPASAPRGGTAIGDAIRKALDVFQGKVDRDQAILLITDGEDQQSYPLDAAAVAAERHVTIFSVGLGDATQGSRIPQTADSKNYVEYKGEQVWSKMDGSLLGEIAMKTSGVYVPAGTKAYDLGELYTTHLHSRYARDAAAQERTRKSEKFQPFLAIAFMSLLVDFCIVPYRRLVANSSNDFQHAVRRSPRNGLASARASAGPSIILAILSVACCNLPSLAIEPEAAVREGLKLYARQKFDDAREKFAAAATELDQRKSKSSAVAAFDEACALHRKGDVEKARDSYLRAGLSQDHSVAVAAHFNLGTLSAEQARTEAGDKPESVATDKRQAIVEHLMQAAAAFRHCLELQPEHPQARGNLELVRLWIKYYSDQWRARDRQKRRDESNLIVFLQFIIDSQTALLVTVKDLPPNTSADGFAELKRAQTELADELPTLKEKIEKELRPSTPATPKGAATANPDESQELEQGIRLLQSWADAAAEKMSDASRYLGARAPAEARQAQQAALEQLDKIWDTVIPFHPLLAKELADQTAIARTLNPEPVQQSDSIERPAGSSAQSPSSDNRPEVQANPAEGEPTKLEIADDGFNELAASQERTLGKSRLLALKAEMELKQLEHAPLAAAPADAIEKPRKEPEKEAQKEAQDAKPAEQAPAIDPEEVKAGYRKAIELAPKAIEQMESALSSLKKKDAKKAGETAEEARRILEEIQNAQPKPKQPPNQNPEDQNKDNDQNNEKEDKKADQSKQDESKSGDEPPEKKQSEPEPENSQQAPNDQSQKQARMSPDRIEEALRKVRERQADKRDRDRKVKARSLGRAPVDKDW